MRDSNPFERPPVEEARHLDTFLRGIQRAVIESVDTKSGKCTLSFESTPATRANVGIPLLHMSISGAGERRKSSWSRRMPSPGDVVLVGFDSNGTPRIVGYDQPSYDILSTLHIEEPFTYGDLVSGEFDDRSSGGAYIRGKATGDLYLAGGLSSLTLSKDRYEVACRTGLHRIQCMSSVRRFGEVKRSPIPFLSENEAKPGIGIPPLANPVTGSMPSLVEDTLDLKSSLPGSPLGQAVCFVSHGNVMDPDVDLIAQGAYGAVGPAGIKKFKVAPVANARFFWRIYDSVPLTDVPIGTPGPLAGVRPFEWGIDQLGNSYINVGVSAGAGFNVYSNNSMTLVSSQLQLAGNVFLGATAVGPLVTPAGVAIPPALKPEFIAGGPAICGTPFVTALTTFLTALDAFMAIAATGSAVTTPVENVAYAKALGGAAAALLGAIAAYGASSPTWLSNSVFIGKSGVVPNVVLPSSAFPL